MLICWPIDNGHLRVGQEARTHAVRQLICRCWEANLSEHLETLWGQQCTMNNTQCQMLGGQLDLSWEAPTRANLIPAEVTRLLRKLACAVTVCWAMYNTQWQFTLYNTHWVTPGQYKPTRWYWRIGRNTTKQQKTLRHWLKSANLPLTGWLTDTDMIRWFGDQIS